jgi:hypothetical protein
VVHIAIFGETPMLNTVLGMILVFAQLSGPGASLPQVLTPGYKPAAPIVAGRKGEVVVSFNMLKGYAINRTPPMSLKLTAIPGLKLEKTEFTSPANDPKSKDEYYVDLPAMKVPVTAAKAGSYEIPGKLVYFFCSKTDGFCSRQVLDVKVPVTVQ